MTPEHERLQQARTGEAAWRKWGPYLSERQWGTVREDAAAEEGVWAGFPHEQARARAYKWGEDGIAGICDEQMRLCFAIALWNGCDPMLKERLFGLANGEGNHGEDVKECYFYLDNTPTHSYMRFLYKYPQARFPYEQLVQVNRERGRLEPEYELTDTGIFDGDRYFDVWVEYAKQTPEDILIRVTVANRGPEEATVHLLPHLWFRNTWWRESSVPRPGLRATDFDGCPAVLARHRDLGVCHLLCPGARELVFTDNETNHERIADRPNLELYFKDGIDRYIVHGETDAVDLNQRGTKAAGVYVLTLSPGASASTRLCLKADAGEGNPFTPAEVFGHFDEVLAQRRREADAFYAVLAPPKADSDEKLILRQAFAGLLWSKQTYIYDVRSWHAQYSAEGANPACTTPRNREWSHMLASDVISVPDKWEYPWFAAWDLAFQTVAFAFIDPDFASQQFELLLRERYFHPNGQIPSSEWNFGDVQPPVHAWAAMFMYRLQRQRGWGNAISSLRRSFHALLLNFTWWVNRRDQTGRSVFEGGFLGLDTAAVLDRRVCTPSGGSLELADGTGWMLLFTQNMLEMALELALHDPVYEELAIKFYEHFVWIGSGLYRIGVHGGGMWDEAHGFFYDVVRFPNGTAMRLKVRAMLGLLPLCAATVYPPAVLQRLPRFIDCVRSFNRARTDLLTNINNPERAGLNGFRLLAALDESKLRRVLRRVLDPQEFLSDFGIRSLSREHEEHPYVFRSGNDEYHIAYRPAESDSGLFGGNSNWRGPIWFPLNLLLLRGLLQLYSYYGDDFRIECPTGSGRFMTLFEVSTFLGQRLVRIFRAGPDGARPVFGRNPRFDGDPHWRDLILFHECFHGDSGAGIGASHQTGWSALVAPIIQVMGDLTAEEAKEGLGYVFERMVARTD